jgi:16S rRNA (cytosine967-C5)-methyltransferase
VISPARAVAFDVLLRVDSGGYASDLLLSESAALAKRDAALASEIVFGCLRVQAQLDFLIEHFSGRPSQRLDIEVHIAIRMAIYQLRYLDRVPVHAAVTESVELVKRARKRSAAGFTNAVLRKVNRDPVSWPNRSIEFSQPEWLLARWDRQFGEQTTNGMAAAFLREPETYVRLPAATGHPGRDNLELEPAEIPGSFRVLSGDTTGLRVQDIRVQDIRVQDIGSQSIVPLLDLRPGHILLDLCAAPGNKTAHALEFGVDAIACDLHWHRLRHVQGCNRVVLDAREPLPFSRKFDRILIDAPCSGTGTLARNPEIRWRLKPTDIVELAEKQVRILAQAAKLLAPGGLLVYSTCSLEREEDEDVVDRFIHENSGIQLVAVKRRTPAIDPGDGFFAAILAAVH